MTERKRSFWVERKKDSKDAAINIQIEHALLRDWYAEIVKTLSIFKKMCRKKKVHCISESEPTRRNCYQEDDAYNHVVSDQMKEGQATIATNETQWTKDLKLQSLTVPLKLDKGSDVNILLISYYKKRKETRR